MRGATLLGVFCRTIESRKGRGGVLRIRPDAGALGMLNILDHFRTALSQHDEVIQRKSLARLKPLPFPGASNALSSPPPLPLFTQLIDECKCPLFRLLRRLLSSLPYNIPGAPSSDYPTTSLAPHPRSRPGG